MKFVGKVYAKMNGRYIECTETIEDLESKIKDLEKQVKNLNVHFVRRSAFDPDIPHKPLPGDYFESQGEGSTPSTRVKGLTWREEYERDLASWERHYA